MYQNRKRIIFVLLHIYKLIYIKLELQYSEYYVWPNVNKKKEILRK